VALGYPHALLYAPAQQDSEEGTMARWIVIIVLLAVFVPGAGAVMAELLQLAAHAVQELSRHSCNGHLVTTMCGAHQAGR
jgi:hypothetical protein